MNENLKRPSQRIYGFDAGKGLAVCGMLIAHTFEAGVCGWDHDAEMAYMNKIPKVLVIILGPLALLCVMGMLFTFLTSITCTLSMIRAESKGKRASMSYLLYRLAFGFVLKGVQFVFYSWWSSYGVFDRLVIQIPIAPIANGSDTLDSIAFIGFLVPLSVHFVFRLSFAKTTKLRVLVLSVLSIVLLSGYSYIATYSMIASSWCFKNNFNLFGYLFSKIGSGTFMIAQSFPFGLIGACVGLIYHETRSWKALWRYCWSLVGVTVVIGAISLLFTKNFAEAALSQMKPCAVRFLELSFELILIVFFTGFTDNPERSVQSRFSVNATLTFMRRISIVSLSCFVYEKWVSNQLMKVFVLFAGEAFDASTKEAKWHLLVVLLFMALNSLLDFAIIYVWEKMDYNYSCEHAIANVLGYVFGRTESVEWKSSNDRVIYGPIHDLKPLVDAFNAQLDSEIELINLEGRLSMQAEMVEMPKKCSSERPILGGEISSEVQEDSLEEGASKKHTIETEEQSSNAAHTSEV